MTTIAQPKTFRIITSSFVNFWLTSHGVRNGTFVFVFIVAVVFPVSVSGDQPLTNRVFSIGEQHDLALQQVGFGSISWFGFSIYDASLWTSDGTFEDVYQSLPIALHITYQRNIASDALADRTAVEWEQLNIISPSQRESWKRRLTDIWPTVKPGESITTLVTPDRKTHFYHNEKYIGTVEDKSFGSALLSIWLDANTSEPKLRQQLIGYTGK